MFERVNKGKRWLYSSPFWKDDCSEKRLKLTPKKTKNTKFSHFQSFCDVSVKVLTDFDVWNV